ncbi:MAG TPA: SIMPL domain-containing protein, partial [Bacillota bacterium]|nr:SIMPL domain-containing protein [Bacillota bacterium]
VVTRLRFQQTVIVVTDELDVVEELAFNPVQLLEANVNIMNSNVEFYYSKIDELKKELVSLATRNAKERAEKMLEQTDVKLGKLISVRSGVFQITEPYSTEVSSLGIYDTSTRKKQISVTASAVFAIK